MSEVTVLDLPAGITSDDWENWLAATGCAAGFRQTPPWAKINSAVNGDSNSLETVMASGSIKAAAMISLRRPAVSGGWVSFLKSKTRLLFKRGKGGTLDCRDGPVLDNDAGAYELSQLLGQIEAQATRLGVDSIHFHGVPPLSPLYENPSLLSVFDNHGYSKSTWLTSIIDLVPDEGTLFSKCDRSVRKAVRKCEREGVTIRECSNENEFYDNFLRHVSSNKHGETREEAERRMALFRIGYPDYYRFFAAEDQDGEPLALLGTFRFNGLATETTSVLMPRAKELKLPAQDALHWHILMAHCKAGERWFDLAGYSPEPKNPKEEGIRRFKRKWGGKEHTIYRYTKNL